MSMMPAGDQPMSFSAWTTPGKVLRTCMPDLLSSCRRFARCDKAFRAQGGGFSGRAGLPAATRLISLRPAARRPLRSMYDYRDDIAAVYHETHQQLLARDTALFRTDPAAF